MLPGGVNKRLVKGLNTFKMPSFDFHSQPLPPLTTYTNVMLFGAI